jgi:hypothetical protein
MTQRCRQPLARLVLWISIWESLLCLAGCGNSSDGGASNGGAGGVNAGGVSAGGVNAGGANPAGTSTGGASTGVGGNGGDCAMVTVDPKYQNNYCNNAADRCYSRANHTAIIAASGQCATGDCLSQAIDLGSGTEKPDDYACFATCIPKKLMEMTGGSISADCSRCPAAVSACGARNCLALCIQNAADPACIQCLCENHPMELNNAGGSCIIDVYANCAGYAPTPAEVGCGM